MKKVIVLGSTGRLGSAILESSQLPGYRICADRELWRYSSRPDYSNYESLAVLFESVRPDVIVNTVALTDVDLCEREQKLAHAINAGIPINIAKWVSLHHPLCRVIQISTDMVYSGSGPHHEESAYPINCYAKTKHDGELAILEIANSVVLRTNFFGKSRRMMYTDWIYHQLSSGARIHVDGSVFFNPLSVNFLIELITNKFLSSSFVGIYNLGSRGSVNKYDFVRSFCEKARLDSVLLSRTDDCSSGFRRGLAIRPCDMQMSISKAENDLHLVFPTIGDEIGKVAKFY